MHGWGVEYVNGVEDGDEDDLAGLCEDHAERPPGNDQSGSEVIEGSDGGELGLDQGNEGLGEGGSEGREEWGVWLLVVFLVGLALARILKRGRQRTQEEVASEGEREDPGEYEQDLYGCSMPTLRP